MAAPTTSYKTEKLPVIKGNSSGGIATQNDIYIAKFLQNTTPPTGDDWGDGYFNSTDTEAEKLDKIKGIFKIDGLVLVAKGAADGSAAETGFIGYCNSRTSGNGLYHNWDNNTSPFVARGSGLKIPIGAAGGGAASTGELLNDAGLNTKPIIPPPVASPSAKGSAVQTPNNAFLGTFDIRSAFYLSTEWGIKIKSLGCQNTGNPAHNVDSAYHSKIVGTIGLGMNGSKTVYNDTDIVVDDPSIIGNYLLYAPNYYEIWVWATNDEGTREVQLSTFLAVPYSLSLKYSPTSFEAAANTLTSGTYYKNSAAIGYYTYLFNDQAAGTPSDGGFYVEPYSGSQYTYALRTTSTGQIDLETIYDWSIQRTKWDYYGFAASNVQSSTQLNAAYNQAVAGSWIDIGDIFYATTDEFYAYSTGTAYAPNGYYMIGMGINNDLATAVWFRLLDGVVVESDNY